MLAVGAACGVPVARIVHGDEVEAALWVRVTERAAKLRQTLVRNQAQNIAAEVSRIFK